MEKNINPWFKTMSGLVILIPVALLLSGIGLVALLWTLRSGQFDDLEGAAERILFEDENIEEKQTPENSRIDSK